MRAVYHCITAKEANVSTTEHLTYLATAAPKLQASVTANLSQALRATDALTVEMQLAYATLLVAFLRILGVGDEPGSMNTSTLLCKASSRHFDVQRARKLLVGRTMVYIGYCLQPG